MNNDNALMMEALRHCRKPAEVLREGDEFEDDFVSPGISRLTSKSPYKVKFFTKPGNPKGIITRKFLTSKGWAGEADIYDKATWWAKRMKPLTFRAAKGHLGGWRGAVQLGIPVKPEGLPPGFPWTFTWMSDVTDSWAYTYVHGFIEGEDFIFVNT